MQNSHRRFPRGPNGEFWLLVAILTLLATLVLLHLAVQREREAGLTVADIQTFAELVGRPRTIPPPAAARSPS